MATPPRPLGLSRNQIAAIVGNDFEAIRQFERLFSVGQVAEDDGGVTRDLAELASTAPLALPNPTPAADYVDFAQYAPFVLLPSRLGWDAGEGSLSLGMASGVTHWAGMNMLVRVTNTSGSTIAKGRVVYFVGAASNGTYDVEPFLANGATDDYKVVGIMAQSLGNGATGLAVCYGILDGVDTSAFSAGAVLYASDSVAGGLTATAPTQEVPIASVLSVSSTQGRLFIKPCCGVSSGGGGGGGSGTVTSVGTGTGLTGGPITTSGTISLANTAVSPGSYGSASNAATFTVDAQGRLTAAGQTAIAITGAQVSGNIAGNAANVTGTVAIANGGTGATSLGAARIALLPAYTGNAGRVLAVNAGATDIEWIAAGGSGTVTSVSGTGTVNGLTLTGTVTTSGSLTLGGTLSNVSLTSAVTGTLPIANGGTGITGTPSNGQLLIGNGTNYTLATLTAGAGMTVTNAAGSITVATGRLTAGATTSGTLVAGDAGDVVEATGNITIPNSVFSARDVVYIRNTTAGSITVSAGAGVTLRWVANTGTRTIAQYGFVSLLFVSASEAWVVGGAGVS